MKDKLLAQLPRGPAPSRCIHPAFGPGFSSSDDSAPFFNSPSGAGCWWLGPAFHFFLAGWVILSAADNVTSSGAGRQPSRKRKLKLPKQAPRHGHEPPGAGMLPACVRLHRPAQGSEPSREELRVTCPRRRALPVASSFLPRLSLQTIRLRWAKVRLSQRLFCYFSSSQEPRLLEETSHLRTEMHS